MTQTTRRTALAFLGLAGTGSAALAHESMVDAQDGNNGVILGSDWSNKKAAEALRRLADGIENRSVDVVKLDLASSLKFNEILTQKFTLEFYLDEE